MGNETKIRMAKILSFFEQVYKAMALVSGIATLLGIDLVFLKQLPLSMFEYFLLFMVLGLTVFVLHLYASLVTVKEQLLTDWSDKARADDWGPDKKGRNVFYQIETAASEREQLRKDMEKWVIEFLQDSSKNDSPARLREDINDLLSRLYPESPPRI